MLEEQPSIDVEKRVEGYTRATDLAWVTRALVVQRDEILARWLDAALAQPFHRGRRDHAVADHIPPLFDALIGFMQRATPRAVQPGAPLDDAAILAAAQGHALTRADQGLQPSEVLAEFRLLRQELGRALRHAVPEDAPSSDVVGAELLLNDALDGATALALAALTAQLEQVREEFLATTVHEIRQPLTRIVGFLQLAERVLDRQDPDLPRARANLRRGRDAADQMGALLATLVDASRTALGGLVLQPATTDLVALLRETIARLEPDAAERVALQVPRGLQATGRWDGMRLAQVFGNLLSNARKYSAPGTPIDIRLRGDAATVAVSVADQGIGIPAEDLPHLFDRYARASNATEQGIEGLGLGLYLCRGIVEAHGGRIWAESAGRGRGATMHVELPRQTPPAAPR